MSGGKVLVVEDELTNAILLKRILNKAGYTTIVAHNGVDALKHLEAESFDAVLTDWMMPQIDGIELIRQMRDKYKVLPLIIMVTALVSDGARAYALESGADDYIAKPIDVEELLTRLKDGLSRHQQNSPSVIVKVKAKEINVKPPSVGVFIATSTGGPPTLIDVFKNMENTQTASFFIVQHGPSWMLETFAQRLERESNFDVQLAVNGTPIRQGIIYLAPGDKHMKISKDYKIKLDEGPKENFVRPAADPLFRSGAETYGKYSVAVVLTGLGKDGTQGAAQIDSVGGKIFVQDPVTAIAPSMPNSIISSDIRHRVVQTEDLGREISEAIFTVNAILKKSN